MSIGSRTHEEFMEEARAFHGYPAPGLIIGGYMVELAKRHMPEGVLYDAVSETAHCLPDAVQLLTPCTFGNGWLRVLPFGIYAVTLYDKATGVDPLVPQGPHPSGHARAPFVRGDHPLPALRLPLPRLLRRDLPLLPRTVPV